MIIIKTRSEYERGYLDAVNDFVIEQYSIGRDLIKRNILDQYEGCTRHRGQQPT